MSTIYIAEDSPMQQELMRAALALREGLEVSFYGDGLELYRAVREAPPQLLILDIIMPSLTGLAVCRMLKFHDDYASIPILVSSSIFDADIRERVARAGADLFLPKPYEHEELLKAVERLLNP